MSKSLNPLFYYYRPGMAGPLVLQTASTADDTTDRPTEPSAPATVDIPLQRLYPVVWLTKTFAMIGLRLFQYPYDMFDLAVFI